MRITYLLASLLCASLVLWPELPALNWLWWLLPLALLGAALKPAWLPSLSLLCLAAAITLWQGHRLMANLLPAACSHLDYTLTLKVVGLPSAEAQGERWRHRFTAEVLSAAGACASLEDFTGKKLLLSWFTDSVELYPGQRWQMQVQLRRPRGQVNPHGQDYQLWLMSQGIYATGSVRNGSVLGQGSGGVDGWRAAFRDRLQDLALADQTRALLMALTLGDRSTLSSEVRRQLQNSGTAHLLAISGLHIGLGAAVGFWLGRGLSVFMIFCLPLRWRVHIHGIWLARFCAIALATGYALFGGLSVSTQRALLMVLLFFASNLMRRYWLWIDIWCLVVLLLLLVNPLQAADPGFYLSAGAVLVLVAVYQGRYGSPRAVSGRIWLWLKPQWWIFVGLLPLSLLFFGGFSAVSVVANSVAIPWVSFVVVPLALLGLVVAPLSAWASQGFLRGAGWAIDQFLWVLNEAAVHWGHWQWFSVSSNSGLLLLLLLAAMWFMLPKPALFMKALLPAFLLLAFSGAGLIEPRQPIRNRLVVFDVGQGLSVYLETAGLKILYDTGPRFGAHTTAMDKIVLPFLRGQAIDQLDYVIVSHNDADHAAGLAALLNSGIRVDHWLVGERAALLRRHPQLASEQMLSCHTRAFVRAGVHFWFAGAGASPAGNDASCVLWLSAPGLRLLLPGDIGAQRELALAQQLPATESVWLVSPHHGSGSSSSYALLSRLPGARPLVSAGFRNRYQHPSPAVTARYEELGMAWLNTAREGALVIQWQADGQTRVQRWRQQARRFWRN